MPLPGTFSETTIVIAVFTCHAVRPFVPLLDEGGFYLTLLEDHFFINLLFLSYTLYVRIVNHTSGILWPLMKTVLIEYQFKQ